MCKGVCVQGGRHGGKGVGDRCMCKGVCVYTYLGLHGCLKGLQASYEALRVPAW